MNSNHILLNIIQYPQRSHDPGTHTTIMIMSGKHSQPRFESPQVLASFSQWPIIVIGFLNKAKSGSIDNRQYTYGRIRLQVKDFKKKTLSRLALQTIKGETIFGAINSLNLSLIFSPISRGVWLHVVPNKNLQSQTEVYMLLWVFKVSPGSTQYK